MSHQNIKQFLIFLSYGTICSPVAFAPKSEAMPPIHLFPQCWTHWKRCCRLAPSRERCQTCWKRCVRKLFLLHLCFSKWHYRVLLQWSWFQAKSQPLPMIIIVHVKPGLALYPASLLEKEIFVLTVAHCVVHVRLAVHLAMDSSLNIGVKICGLREVWSLKPVNPQLSSQLISVRSLQRAPPLRSPGKNDCFCLSKCPNKSCWN